MFTERRVGKVHFTSAFQPRNIKGQSEAGSVCVAYIRNLLHGFTAAIVIVVTVSGGNAHFIVESVTSPCLYVRVPLSVFSDQ